MRLICIYCRKVAERELPSTCECGQELTFIPDIESTWDGIKQLFTERGLDFDAVYPGGRSGFVNCSIDAEVMRSLNSAVSRDIYRQEDDKCLAMMMSVPA